MYMSYPPNDQTLFLSLILNLAYDSKVNCLALLGKPLITPISKLPRSQNFSFLYIKIQNTSPSLQELMPANLFRNSSISNTHGEFTDQTEIINLQYKQGLFLFW